MFKSVFYITCFCFAITFPTRINCEYEAHAFSTCFDEIGCVDFSDKWYDKAIRPRNLEPLDRHTVRTEFLLMKNPNNESRDLVYDIMTLKKETITVAGFKSKTCTIFVFHDFTSNGYTGWIKHLVVAVSRRTDCNVVSVDWEAGAEPPFEQAISNARVVALEAKAFITLLKSCFDQSLDAIHLIGHGVGAHIAGYVGKLVPGIQRITGLDPTGPYFEKMPKEVRLDSGDAKYVEVLHTDSFNHRSQGGKEAIGHADFIINAAGHQPGCNDSSHMPAFTDVNRDSLQEGKILAACSHKRAFKYYIQALEDCDCHFIGIKCESYALFQEGKCSSCANVANKSVTCAAFGLEEAKVNTKNNTYYLLTFSKKPFCMHTYSVNITVNHSETIKDSEGYFEFILVDETNKVTNTSSGSLDHHTTKFTSGHVYSVIMYGLSPHINIIKEAKVKWTFKSNKLCIMCDKAIAIKDISIKRISITDTDLKLNMICPVHSNSELKSGDYVEFMPCATLYGADYEKTGNAKTPESTKPEEPQAAANSTSSSNNETTKSDIKTRNVKRGEPVVVGVRDTSCSNKNTALRPDKEDHGMPSNASSNTLIKTTTESGVKTRCTTQQTHPPPDKECASNANEVKQFKDCFDAGTFRVEPPAECNIHDDATSTTTEKLVVIDDEVNG